MLEPNTVRGAGGAGGQKREPALPPTLQPSPLSGSGDRADGTISSPDARDQDCSSHFRSQNQTSFLRTRSDLITLSFYSQGSWNPDNLILGTIPSSLPSFSVVDAKEQCSKSRSNYFSSQISWKWFVTHSEKTVRWGDQRPRRPPSNTVSTTDCVTLVTLCTQNFWSLPFHL